MDSTGRYRLLPRRGDERLLLDRTDYETVAVDATTDAAASLRTGNLVDATLEFGADAAARVVDVDVVRDTVFEYVGHAAPMFEAAADCWMRAQADGEGMNSRITRNTDAEVNGVLYVFANSHGRDVFEEFRQGARPLEPLLDRVTESEGPDDREVFVLRAPAEPYVVVYIALERGGRLARTVRQTYDLPLE